MLKVNVTDLNKGYKHFKIDSGKGNELESYCDDSSKR